MTNLAKEQTAAQIVARVRARFERPELSDVYDILGRSKLQARQAQESCDSPWAVPHHGDDDQQEH